MNNNYKNGEKMSTQKRVEWIDEFRGIAMLLVVVEHTGLRFWGRIILAFHMPCFFLLTGYLYTYKQQSRYSVREYLFNEIYRIGVPYIFYFLFKELINYIVIPMTNNISFNYLSVKGILRDMLYLNVYWFIPCLFISGLLFHIFSKTIFRKNNLFPKCLVIILCLVIVSISNGYQLPFGLGQCCMAIIFLTIGSCSKEVVEKINGMLLKNKIGFFFFFFLILCMCVIYNFYCGDNFMMYINSYGKIVPAVIGAIAGSYALLVGTFILQPLFNKCKIIKKIVIWFGTNSLLLYPAHMWGIDLSRLVRKYIIASEMNWIVTFIINTSFAMLVSIIIVFFSNKYIPILGGKKRRIR